MPDPEPRIDALIIGGGIAGLWTLARLRAAGLDAALVEPWALGTGQTIASQGIIHGGVKYALTPAGAGAARAIAAMPGRWQAALDGTGDIDLRGVAVRAPAQHLFTTASIASRLAGVAASRALRTGVDRLAPADYPVGLRGAPPTVAAYRVDEPVLDVPSLLRVLRARLEPALWHAEPRAAPPPAAPIDGHRIDLRTREGTLRVVARLVVLSAGAGNEPLLRHLAGEGQSPAQQRRPLHMVMVRGPLPPLHAHAVAMSDTPRLTITTHADAHGRTVWYVGGALAESGVSRDRDAQLETARAELGACLPWIDFAPCAFAAFRIDRAEGLTAGGRRPDGPVVAAAGAGIIAAWPTKLALAPLVADRVLELALARLAPGRETARPALTTAPPVAAPPWDDPEIAWS